MNEILVLNCRIPRILILGFWYWNIAGITEIQGLNAKFVREELVQNVLSSNDIENWWLTELTAHVDFCFVTGCSPWTDTIHAPQPPSRHMNLVPGSFACCRMKVFKDVSAGTDDGVAGI
jgi:hypothetical protein